MKPGSVLLTRLASVAVWGTALLFGAGFLPQGAQAADPGEKERALALLRAGDPEAAPALEAISAADPADAAAAYFAARAEEAAGRPEEARCVYLRLEKELAGKPLADLAASRRLELERRSVEGLLSLGLDFSGPAEQTDRILILPPENTGTPREGGTLGLAWSYLLTDALRGSQYCPVSMPEMLAVLDLLKEGKALRAGQDLLTYPVNTIPGLRARLRLLPAPDGHPYLYPEGVEVADALERFQTDQGLERTGEADLATQARIEQALESLLRRPPPPLDPALLTRAAKLTGAGLLLRGSYRIDAGRVVMRLTLLDAEGNPALPDPISLIFPEEEAARNGRVAAALLLGREQPRPSPVDGFDAATLEAAAASILLLDRGAWDLAEARWQSSPPVWFTWPSLDGIRRGALLRGEDRARLEEETAGRWLKVRVLSARSAFDGFLRDLDVSWSRPVFRGLGESRPGILPVGAYAVVGTDGVVHIHAEAP